MVCRGVSSASDCPDYGSFSYRRERTLGCDWTGRGRSGSGKSSGDGRSVFSRCYGHFSGDAAFGNSPHETGVFKRNGTFESERLAERNV